MLSFLLLTVGGEAGAVAREEDDDAVGFFRGLVVVLMRLGGLGDEILFFGVGVIKRFRVQKAKKSF